MIKKVSVMSWAPQYTKDTFSDKNRPCNTLRKKNSDQAGPASHAKKNQVALLSFPDLEWVCSDPLLSGFPDPDPL
jgi:hypothetical protein